MKNPVPYIFVAIVVAVTLLVIANNSIAHDESDNRNIPLCLVNLPTCPKSHIDSIIPIVYGLPTKEAFQQEDSGFIYLGGCDMSPTSPKWYCTKHKLTF